MGAADRTLAAICRRQFSVFAWHQARASGIPDSTVARRIEDGRYRRLLPGVLAEAGAPDTWEARAMAAQLAVGGEAVLTRFAAARALGLDVREPADAGIAVMVRTRTFEALPDIRVHRTRHLQPEDVTTVGPLRTTSVTRSLCDLAYPLPASELRRAVAHAVRQSRTDATQLRSMAARLGRFRGKAPLLSLMDELHPLERDCRSELESRFLRVMVRAGRPPTAMNHPVRDARGRRRVLDAVWLPQKLPVELDSRLTHGTLLDWNDDLRRENDVVLTGWRSFLRFSWDDVVNRPDEVAASVQRALDAADADRVSD